MSDTPEVPESAGTPETPVTPQPPVPLSEQPTPPTPATLIESPAPAAFTPPTEPTTPGAPVPPSEATAASTEPIAPVQTAPVTRKRSATVGIVAALAVGAIVGGGVGAGVVIAVTGGNHSATPTTTALNPTAINVNDPDNATTVTAVAAKASPSVVTISVTAGQSGGTGSGVILNTDGYILTNTHVVTLDGASSTGVIKVTTNDGRILSAKVIGTDPVVDLAVIKVDATGLTPADFADSSKLNVGDTAIAIGAPLGLSGTVTDGIVSALNRSITIASSAVPDSQSTDQGGTTDPFKLWGFNLPGQQSTPTSSTATISLPVIQTDAAINPGNSGGALLNSAGQVIGINVAIASAGDTSSTGSQSGSIGVGFAIPANLAKRVSSELIASGKATHGLLGASIAQDASATSTVVGATVSDVQAGGAAANAGIKAGDVITGINGLPVTDYTDLIAQVRALAAGATTNVVYLRGGSSFTASVTLGTLK